LLTNFNTKIITGLSQFIKPYYRSKQTHTTVIEKPYYLSSTKNLQLRHLITIQHGMGLMQQKNKTMVTVGLENYAASEITENAVDCENYDNNN